MTDKGLISKIYEQITELNTKKEKNSPIKKIGEHIFSTNTDKWPTGTRKDTQYH